jgi:hypothetical protein
MPIAAKKQINDALWIPHNAEHTGDLQQYNFDAMKTENEF